MHSLSGPASALRSAESAAPMSGPYKRPRLPSILHAASLVLLCLATAMVLA